MWCGLVFLCVFIKLGVVGVRWLLVNWKVNVWFSFLFGMMIKLFVGLNGLKCGLVCFCLMWCGLMGLLSLISCVIFFSVLLLLIGSIVKFVLMWLVIIMNWFEGLIVRCIGFLFCVFCLLMKVSLLLVWLMVKVLMLFRLLCMV